MQLFCVISTGEGQLLAASSRAPDLLRRELSAATGAATLVWCSVPPPGLKAASLVKGFEADLASKLEGAGRMRQVLVLTRFALLGPIATTLLARIRTTASRLYRQLKFRAGAGGRSLRGSVVEVIEPPRR